MRCLVLAGAFTACCLVFVTAIRAQQPAAADSRSRLESRAALLDGHTRRLYYEIRKQAEENDEQSQLLSDARELWRAARRLNDQAMDGASTNRLEREVRQVEAAFHAVEDGADTQQMSAGAGPSLMKRLHRIERLVHDAHNNVHDLSETQLTPQNAQSTTPRPPNFGYSPTEPLPRVRDVERRAADLIDPPTVQVRPDGFYFDGRRFPLPFGR